MSHLRLVEPLAAAPSTQEEPAVVAPLDPVEIEDYGLAAQRVAEAHLAACSEGLYAEEEGESSDFESPASAPFCGCETCVVREVLYAAWPIIADAVRAEQSSQH